ncbi:uncharacterized protein BDR25DRAFT_300730 [Lindgomyces ingoldianus]|uniref:Uncharacterized protein n=1 Tax=Lindgomyces ingoldianus TaxID=673940 RepID=A0ACB6RB84_9PLEO|nr:uncharacterized protein BDR25DRAFT_300730 [Lindgomyces ingoldianus]KAF2475731.1 hypothetical protein BDR25DRAFT_300730 [Lindgomyces ingoldianus]
MGSRHVGELLLRPTLSHISLPLARRRTPAAAFQWASRPLHVPTSPRSARPQPTPNPTSELQVEPHPHHVNTTSAIDSLIGMSVPRARSARTPSSSDELRAAQHSSRPFGADFSRPNNNYKRPKLQFDDMAMAAPVLGEPQQHLPVVPQAPEVYPRLNPSTGRTVELDVSKGRDIVRGLGMLGSLMARNKVKADFMKQRFHERPGLKRKRLKSERWRARFKVGFRKVVGRVSELTRKGW